MIDEHEVRRLSEIEAELGESGCKIVWDGNAQDGYTAEVIREGARTGVGLSTGQGATKVEAAEAALRELKERRSN